MNHIVMLGDDEQSKLAASSLVEECVSNVMIVEKLPDGTRKPHVVASHAATQEQREAYFEHSFLTTGAVWRNMPFGERVTVLAALELDTAQALTDEINDVLPANAKQLIAFWQRQINTGECWFAPGSIGRRAHELIEEGYCLWSKKALKNFYGLEQPTRYNARQGIPGTEAFVTMIMSPDYTSWIKLIE
jgi:hypothetical protein